MAQKLKDLKEGNKLFVCLNYLETNFDANSKFKLRLNDFCKCWAAIETQVASNKKITLPPEDPSFRSGYHPGAYFKHIEPYYKLREALLNVTEREVNEFRDFINQAPLSLSVNAKAVLDLLQKAQIITEPKLPPAYVEVPRHLPTYLSNAEPETYQPSYLSSWSAQFEYQLPVAEAVQAGSRSMSRKG